MVRSAEQLRVSADDELCLHISSEATSPHIQHIKQSEDPSNSDIPSNIPLVIASHIRYLPVSRPVKHGVNNVPTAPGREVRPPPDHDHPPPLAAVENYGV